MNPANAIRFGNYLLGTPITCVRDPQGNYAAKLATIFSRGLWKRCHCGCRFSWLMPRSRLLSKFERGVGAKVMRRLRRRGFCYLDHDGFWHSYQGDRRSARWRAHENAERDLLIRNILNRERTRLFEIALQRDDVRSWLLNAIRYVKGTQPTLDELLRFGAIVEGRAMPSFWHEGNLHGN